jgi:hypothetical protein
METVQNINTPTDTPLFLDREPQLWLLFSHLLLPVHRYRASEVSRGSVDPDFVYYLR